MYEDSAENVCLQRFLFYHLMFFSYVDDRHAYADKKTTNDSCSHGYLHSAYEKTHFSSRHFALLLFILLFQ